MCTVYELLRIGISLILINIIISYMVTSYEMSSFVKRLLYFAMFIGMIVVYILQYCLPMLTVISYIVIIIEMSALMGVIVVHYPVLSRIQWLLYIFVLTITTSLLLMQFLQSYIGLGINAMNLVIVFLISIVGSMVLKRVKEIKKLELCCIITTIVVTLITLLIYIESRYVNIQLNIVKGSVLVYVIVDIFLLLIGHALTNFMSKVEYQSSRVQYANDKYDIERINRMYGEARRLRHDLKHCIVTMKGYIKEHQYEKVNLFLDQLVDEKIDAFAYVKYCNNQVLNYMINDKFEQCRKLGITHKCIVMGEIPQLNDVDLSILLGNLLDNAIEASAKSTEKLVELHIYSKNNISISVENSLKESILNRKIPFLTTKKDDYYHGFGMKSIYDIVSQYNGEIRYEESDGMMICNVLLLYQ